MTTTTPQKLIWENPSSLFNVTVPINITWQLSTFNVVNLGNFEMNMWLLRHDNAGVTVLKSYPPILLAGQRKVQSLGILYTPTTDDLDLGIVQTGNHQLAWEFYSNNTTLNPAGIRGKGFSKGFQFRAQPSSSSSSSSSSSIGSSTASSSQISQTPSISGSTTSSIPTSSTTAPNVNSATTIPTATGTSTSITPSSTNQGVVIGLSVGFGALLGAAIISLLFWFLHRRSKRKVQGLVGARKDSGGSSMTEGWDGGGERGKMFEPEPGIVEAGSGKMEGPVEAGDGRRRLDLGPVELA